jgi:hypothetical protein
LRLRARFAKQIEVKRRFFWLYRFGRDGTVAPQFLCREFTRTAAAWRGVANGLKNSCQFAKFVAEVLSFPLITGEPFFFLNQRKSAFFCVPNPVGKYSGSAQWLLRVTLDGLFGLRLASCLPRDWESCRVMCKRLGPVSSILIVQ